MTNEDKTKVNAILEVLRVAKKACIDLGNIKFDDDTIDRFAWGAQCEISDLHAKLVNTVCRCDK